MRKYVLSERKNGYSSQVQNVYNYRIKKYAVQALKDLALLAQRLPEDQQAEIFNRENMYELFRALFKLDSKLWEDKELLRKKRRRLLPLCYEIIMLLDDSTFAHLIAPLQWEVMTKEGGHLVYLKAVYYRSLISPEEEERKLRE
ncbi:MAG: hypothetical protein QHH24_08110 [Candidatus Bathyarchaeota archaeon]|nr:hypothetical protein [Candidatus Bathyarchaeota archaeon]